MHRDSRPRRRTRSGAGAGGGGAGVGPHQSLGCAALIQALHIKKEGLENANSSPNLLCACMKKSTRSRRGSWAQEMGSSSSVSGETSLNLQSCTRYMYLTARNTGSAGVRVMRQPGAAMARLREEETHGHTGDHGPVHGHQADATGSILIYEGAPGDIPSVNIHCAKANWVRIPYWFSTTCNQLIHRILMWVGPCVVVELSADR